MKKLIFIIIILGSIKDSSAQNVGIGSTTPLSKLDVNGDLSLRSSILQCIAGDNISTNALTNKFSNYTIQLSGSGSFTVNGITGGTDGRIMNIFNNTGFAFTIQNEYLNTPIVANRILTGSDSQVVIFPQNSVSLRYIGSLSRWVVTGTHRSDLWSYYGTNIHNTNIGNVGIGVDTAKAGLHIISNNGIIAKGDTLSNNNYDLTESGPGAKLIWHPKKAAFIAGLLDSYSGNINNWDEDSIGFGAMNLGYANKVKGEHSFAAGIGNYIGSSGFGSVAIGHSNLADSNECVAIGFGNEAHGRQAVAIGTGSEAWGRSSLATGYASKSLGYSSTAGGYFSTAKGDYSFSNGYKNYSGAPYSFTAGIQDSIFEFNSPYGGARSAAVFGWDNKVKGAFSLTVGTSNRIDSASYNSLVAGFGNKSEGNENIVLGKANSVFSKTSVAIGRNNFMGSEGYSASGLDFAEAIAIGSGNYVANRATAIGYNNTIVSDSSIVIGKSNLSADGMNNIVLGNSSFGRGNYTTAIGYKASTNFKNYSVCIGASGIGATPYSVANEHDNEFMVYAEWYRLWTSSGGTSVYLTPGSNAWLSTCDKRTKENFEPVNREEVLQKLSAIPLHSWNYKKQDPKTFRHYGIMAQDFYNAFGKDKYGTIGSDTTVNPIDMMGIAYSAIQALEKRTQKIEEQQKQILELQTTNAALKLQNEKLLNVFEKLNQKVESIVNTKKEINTVLVTKNR